MLFQISEAAVHRCSSQQVFLKISQYLQENNFIKTRLQRRCFPVNLAKFSKAVFYKTLLVAVSGISLSYLRLKDCAPFGFWLSFYTFLHRYLFVYQTQFPYVSVFINLLSHLSVSLTDFFKYLTILPTHFFLFQSKQRNVAVLCFFRCLTVVFYIKIDLYPFQA